MKLQYESRPSLRLRTHELLESPDPDRLSHRVANTFLLILIVVNVVASVMETVPRFDKRYGSLFSLIEVVSLGVFTIEYFARIWAAGASSNYRGVLGALRFALKPVMIVDAIATFPSLLFPILDLRSARSLRLFRFVRMLKLLRYSRGLRIILLVLRRQKEALVLCVSFVGVLLLFASSLLYFVENSAQPDVFSSIPATMWWAVCTLTTVGYGDIYPVTVLGKALASVLALFGVGLFALPAGILAAGFSDAINSTSAMDRCPACGAARGDCG